MKITTETILNLNNSSRLKYTLYSDGRLQCRYIQPWSIGGIWKSLKTFFVTTLTNKPRVEEFEIPQLEANKLRFLLCGKSFKEMTGYEILQKEIVEFFEDNYSDLTPNTLTEGLLRKLEDIRKTESENVFDWIEILLILLYVFNQIHYKPYELIEVAAHKIDLLKETTGSMSSLIAAIHNGNSRGSK